MSETQIVITSKHDGVQIFIPNNKPVEIVEQKTTNDNAYISNMFHWKDDVFLKRFDLSRLNTDRGKRILVLNDDEILRSQCVSEIVRYHRKIPYWSVINSPDVSTEWNNILENLNVITSNQPNDWIDKLKEYKKRMIDMNKFWSIPNTDPVRYAKDPTGAIVLNGLSEDNEFPNCKELSWLYYNSKNFKAWVLIASNRMNISKINQHSQIFITKDTSKEDLEKIHDTFTGIIPFEEFMNIFNKITNLRNGWLVVDMESKSHDLEDRVFLFQH